MAEFAEPKPSRHEFSAAYAGAGREHDHSIDVQLLAPALLAFGKLLREANYEFNGKKSTSKVLVVSDFEHKCFNINFELVLNLYEHLKSFVASEDVRSAKDILEWVGILAPPIGAPLSYFGFLKWRRGRKVKSVEPIVDVDKSGMVEVRVEGDGNTIEVHNHVYALSRIPRPLELLGTLCCRWETMVLTN